MVMRMMPESLDWSAECDALTSHFEGEQLTAYDDGTGKWTIGRGHTRGVKPGMVITAEQSAQYHREDLDEAANVVRRVVKVPLSQGEFDALTSFVFNLGTGRKGGKDGFATLKNGQPSTMLRLLNKGDYAGAAAQFDRWVYMAGAPANGLRRRRGAERAMFECGDWRVAAQLPVQAGAVSAAPATMKPLAQSRTVRGGVAGTAIAGAAAAAAEVADLAGVAGEAGQQVQTVAGLLPPGWLPWVVAAVLAVTVGYMLYRRIDDHRQSQG